MVAAAQALAPAVVFIDEADALAASRGGADESSAHGGTAGEASARTTAALLAAMDALQGVCADARCRLPFHSAFVPAVPTMPVGSS